jgi:hypothetical protein
MAFRNSDPFRDDKYGVATRSAPMGQMQQIDAEDTLRPHRWDVRQWRKRTWGFIVAALVVIIIIIVVAVVEVNKNNRYPDYTPLKYTIEDTCTHSPSCS